MKGRKLPLYLGIILISLMGALTLLSLVFTPHDPTEMAVRARFTPPSTSHWFGTDNYGRDVFSRVVSGGQVSLLVGLLAVGSGMTVGVFLGAFSGFYGKWIDEILMRIADGFYAFPAFLLALLAVTLYGPGKTTVLVAIAIGNIPIFMRLTRATFLKLRQESFVEAARALGASDWRIIFSHVLPNALEPLLVQASVNLAGAILAEASLSYLGVGVQPPAASWGRMLREAQSYGGLAPWTLIFPGLFIGLTVLGFNLLGDGLRGKKA